ERRARRVDVGDATRAGASAVGRPELGAAAVVGAEIDRGADRAEAGRIRAPPEGIDVRELDRALLGAVALPELPSVLAVVGAEVEPSADRGEAHRDGAAELPDVLHPERALVGAVAPPELVVALRVDRAEHRNPVEIGDGRRGCIVRVRRRGDVLHEDGAGGGAVGLPELAVPLTEE